MQEPVERSRCDAPRRRALPDSVFKVERAEHDRPLSAHLLHKRRVGKVEFAADKRTEPDLLRNQDRRRRNSVRMSPARSAPRLVLHHVAERSILDRRTRPVAEIPVVDTFERHVVHLPRHGILDRKAKRLPYIRRLLHDKYFETFSDARRKLLEPLHGRKRAPADDKPLRLLRHVFKRINGNILYAEFIKNQRRLPVWIEQRDRLALPLARAAFRIYLELDRVGPDGCVRWILSAFRKRELRDKPVPLFGVRRLRLEGNRNELHVALHQGHLLRSRRGDASADLFHAPFRRRRVLAETVPHKNKILFHFAAGPVGVDLVCRLAATADVRDEIAVGDTLAVAHGIRLVPRP